MPVNLHSSWNSKWLLSGDLEAPFEGGVQNGALSESPVKYLSCSYCYAFILEGDQARYIFLHQQILGRKSFSQLQIWSNWAGIYSRIERHEMNAKMPGFHAAFSSLVTQWESTFFIQSSLDNAKYYKVSFVIGFLFYE